LGVSPVQVGKYQLLDRIGAGGMAEVHLARVVGAAGFEKLVVVKRLLPALAEEKDYVSQFIDEARLAATFSHANIVSTFDFGEADGSYYIAMEYVEGKNLRRVQDVLERRGKRLPEPAAVFVVSELCRGLEYAHTRKDSQGNPMRVVHRDVSPQNVVVSYGGDVKVLDFGIAKSSAREFQTAAGIVKGKLRYMSPEQVMGEAIDGRSDLFAAGVILWELTYGKRPMPDLPDTELVQWVRKGEFTRPATLPAAPPDLEAIFERALAPDPTVRYPTSGDFARALTRYNTQHWPDFTPGDLGRLLESEFGEDMRKERAWIAGILSGFNEPSISVHVAPASLKSYEQPSRDEIPTVSTPTGGIKTGGPANLGIPRTPRGTPIPGTISRGFQVPSKELPLVQGQVASSTSATDTAAPRPRGASRGKWLGLAIFFAIAATGAGIFGPRLLFHGAKTPLPTPTTMVVATTTVPTTATPAPTPTAATPTPTRVAVPTARPLPTHTRIAIATPPPTPAPTPYAVPAKLSINVESGWAEVWIDGVKVKSETPLLNYRLAPGSHEIAVVRDGKRISKRIVLNPGEPRTEVLALPK
jgi:serine/threonine protein kinase